jgi:hypothetical protein
VCGSGGGGGGGGIHTRRCFPSANLKIPYFVCWLQFILVKQFPGRGPEQRESEKTVLYLQMIVILISYTIIYYNYIIKLLIIENRPSQNRKQNTKSCYLSFESFKKVLY